MEMDAAALRQVCKERNLYQTPRLNERLYCNFRGFMNIGGLEEYTALKALFMEGNAIESLAGLPPLPELKCLFLQSNRLTSLDDNLACLPSLDTLNVSSNRLTQLDNLSGCTALRTLLAADNQLSTAASVAHLADCPWLEAVDLQNNKLEDSCGLLSVLRRLPHLKCLYLKGNPFVSSMHSYRKSVLSAIPSLTYLDDRPVFEVERRCAEAWARGGLEAERAERAIYVNEKEEREQAHFKALQKVREEGFRKRREKLGLPPGATDPFFDTYTPVEGHDEEPPELVAARERLAALQAAKGKLEGAATEGEGEAEAKAEGEELPGLSDLDMLAVLEESRARRAGLLAEAGAVPTTENTAPNTGTAAPAGGMTSSTAASSTTGPAAPAGMRVPSARRTAEVRDSSCSTACQPSPAPGPACQQEEEGGVDATLVQADELLAAQQHLAACSSSGPMPAADQDDARSTASDSIASEDDLDALD